MLLARRAFGYPLTFSKSIGGPPSRRFWTAASSRWGSISAFEVSSSPASFRYSSVERRLEMSFLLIAGMGLAIVVLLAGSGRGAVSHASALSPARAAPDGLDLRLRVRSSRATPRRDLGG